MNHYVLAVNGQNCMNHYGFAVNGQDCMNHYRHIDRILTEMF